MKNIKFIVLVVMIILILFLSGCSEGQALNDDKIKIPKKEEETELYSITTTPFSTKTIKYTYATKSESFSIENNDVTLYLVYDERTNTFIGNIDSQSEKKIENMVINVIYDSGLTVTKRVYTEIRPGENSITCLGTYEDPSRWRIEFSFRTDENIEAIENNSIIDIKHIGDVIPDDGIVIDGYRYASKEQTYYLEKYGLKINAYYISSNGGNFRLIIENTTDKDIGGFDIGVKMLGINRIDLLENYSIEPGDSDKYLMFSFGYLFDLWRPVIIDNETGKDTVKDEETIIIVKSNSAKTENGPVTVEDSENSENCSDWPTDMPEDIPCFSKGNVIETTRISLGLQQNINIFIDDAMISDFDNYIGKVKKYGFIEITISEKEDYKTIVLKRGDEELQLYFYYRFNQIKISYIG